jgi:hypothetical protein
MKRLFILMGLVFTLIILGCVPALGLDDSNFSVGVGMGIPYGVLGGSLNCGIGDYVEVSAGVGLAMTTLGYSVGAKVYLRPPEEHLRFRLSGYYGTNCIVYDLYGDSTAYNGVTVGFGGKYSFNRRGAVALDVMYIVNSPEFEAAGYTIDGRIKIAAGYIFQL